MSLHRFFLEDQILADEADETLSLRLSPDDLKHARVLRLHEGEHIAVVDGSQDYFECEIVSFDGSDLRVRITLREGGSVGGPHVALFQGLAKGDKLETVIRHATEVGVDAFVPLKCARSVMKIDAKKSAAKAQRWRSIAKSAAMQSGRMSVPEVSEPVGVSKACEMLRGATSVVICWEEAPETETLREALRFGLSSCGMPVEDARVAIVVGPEGGLEREEVDQLLASNSRARLVSLGPVILRTETAGVVAPALVRYELGGLGNVGGRVL